MLKVLIAVGGTGGHLFPAMQLAEMLEDSEVVFAGHKLETSPFFEKKFPFHEIVSSPKKKNIPTLLKGLFQSMRLILKFRPDVVVGFGSFHAFPLLLASIILRKKIVLFEANCTLGQVNRLFAPFAKKIAFQFQVDLKKAVYVPLLPWKMRALKANQYEKDPNRVTILVFGGSQGAQFINETFYKAAKLIDFPYRVIHLTGKSASHITYSAPSIVKEFEEDMAAVYAVADFAICRAGASTIAELIRYEIPAVVIPYPYAHDHQRKNGEYLKNGVRLLLQKEASPERLTREISALKNNLQEHKQALRAIKLPQATDLGQIVRVVGEKS